MSIRELLDPTNSALIFIDHQPQMSFGVANIDRQTLKNNTVALAKAGKIFNVPVIYTSVETKSFSGYIWPELLAVHPDVKPIERTSMNSWEDDAFVAAVKATGRKKLVISALWTEVCLTFPALMALEAGYEDGAGGGGAGDLAAGAAGVPARLVAQSDLRCGNGPGARTQRRLRDGRGLRLYHGAWRAGA